MYVFFDYDRSVMSKAVLLLVYPSRKNGVCNVEGRLFHSDAFQAL